MAMIFTSTKKRWTTKRQDRAMQLMDRMRKIIFEVEAWDTLPSMAPVNKAIVDLEAAIMAAIDVESTERQDRHIKRLMAGGR